MKQLSLIAALALIALVGCTETAIETIDVAPAADTTGIGLTAQFTATARDADGNVVSDVEFTWTSSSAAIATVDEDGLATGVATGSCTITAASGDVEGTAALVITTGPTHHSGAITADETWYPSGNPHIIDDDVWTENNATLTILPGCVVKFEPLTELYTGYQGAGAIIADGKVDTTIIFTSNVASPSAGDYIGISLWDYTMNTTSFSYCTIEYAGSNANQGAFYAEDYLQVKINNCTIRNSSSTGVRLWTTASFTSFTNNTITGCASYPLHINCEYARTIGSGNSFTGNTLNGVYITGSTVHTTGTWINPGVPYVLGQDVEVGDNNTSPVLTIAPGTTVKFQPDVELYTGYSASGGIIADGTTGRITFTSNVASPSPGDWSGIGFYNLNIDASSRMVNCNILYGGGYSVNYGNIYIEDAMPVITGDSIGYSSSWGIFTYGIHPDPDSLLAHNTFFSNAGGNVGP